MNENLELGRKLLAKEAKKIADNAFVSAVKVINKSMANKYTKNRMMLYLAGKFEDSVDSNMSRLDAANLIP